MPGAPPSAAIHVWIKAEFDGITMEVNERPRDRLHLFRVSRRQHRFGSRRSPMVSS
jgi:hypothetical protein